MITVDQQLNVFIMTAKEKNFSRAAAKLHMTQPAVSQYIKSLEEQLGAMLLERNNKSVSLTQAGEVVYHHANEIVALYQHMQHLIHDMVTLPSGPISIGASYTFGEYKLPHIIAEIRKRYPDISPSITIDNTSHIINLVGNQTIDIGIIEGNSYEHSHLYDIHPFMKDEMGVIASVQHPLANEKTIPPSALKNDTWIIREEGSGTREITDIFFQQAQFKPSSPLCFGSTQVIKESVEANLGIAFLSKTVVQKELSIGSLCLLDVQGLPLIRSFSSVTRRSPFMTKAMKVFLEYLHD